MIMISTELIIYMISFITILVARETLQPSEVRVVTLVEYMQVSVTKFKRQKIMMKKIVKVKGVKLP